MENFPSRPDPCPNPEPQPPRCTVFAGHRRVASGPLTEVERKLKKLTEAGRGEPILVFDDGTGEIIEINLKANAHPEGTSPLKTTGDHGAAAPTSPRRGPGRPKLGVLSREVTLLPGHWDWLDGQPGGASAALRRLVHEAKRSGQDQDRVRHAQEAVYRFMTTMAGDFPGFEEALRAFYRRDHQRFETLLSAWPKDVRGHIKKLAAAAL